MGGKHVPQRTCVVCREKADKRLLTRLVRTDGQIHIDPTGKRDGRGAYLCNKAACWDRVIRTDVLSAALQTGVTDADRERLRQARPPEFS